MLSAGAEAIGLALDDAQIGRLIAYRDLLARWNRVHNLTAVRDPHEMLVQHLLDSLAVLPALRRQCGDHASRVLDVGSGGGLPGLVWAIAWPALQIVCVDAVAKKAGFIRQAAAELGLPNVKAVHARVELLQEAPFDVITARAFATLADLVTLTRTHLAPGGVWLAMKGRRPEAEMAELRADIEMFHVEPVAVPGLDAERCLVWLRPCASRLPPETPSQR